MTLRDSQVSPEATQTSAAFAPSGPAPAVLSLRSRLCPALAIVALLLGFSPSQASAEVETLAQGDLAVGAYQLVEPFNRYWYHVLECSGTTEGTEGQAVPCSNFSIPSYSAIEPPAGQSWTIPSTVMSSTGLRVEYGVLPQLTVHGETQFVYSSTGSPTSTLGDSRLGARYRLLDGAQVLSLASQVKFGGFYDPARFGAPGAQQFDLEMKALYGGYADRRRFFYDFGFGYRVRFRYPTAAFITVSPISYADENDTTGTFDSDTGSTYTISGPADEVFFDMSLGYFATRKTMFFLTANINNSTKGIHLGEYFRAKELDAQGRPLYAVSSDTITNPSAELMLTSLEEDYLRLGVGALMKVFSNATFYLHYSYVALGQNTTAFYVIPNTRIPIGAVAAGLEFTFGLKPAPTGAPADGAARGDDLRNEALSRKLSRVGGSPGMP